MVNEEGRNIQYVLDLVEDVLIKNKCDFVDAVNIGCYLISNAIRNQVRRGDTNYRRMKIEITKAITKLVNRP